MFQQFLQRNRLVIVVVLAGAFVLVAGWLVSEVFGLRVNLCSASDTDAIDCLRNWVDPVAAIFTLAAIAYAALQVREATRQSDAAVRGSLTRLRDDLEDDHAAITELFQYTLAIQSEGWALAAAGQKGAAPVSILRLIHDQKAKYDDAVRVMGRRSFVEALNGRNRELSEPVIKFFGRIYQSRLDHGVRSGSRDVSSYLIEAWPRLQADYPKAKNVLYEYERRLHDEINAVTETIAQFDREVLASTRAKTQASRDAYNRSLKENFQKSQRRFDWDRDHKPTEPFTDKPA